MNAKLLILLAAGALLGVVPAIPSTAQSRPTHCRIPVFAYDAYQGPDGSYDSLADFTRDIKGIPCGIDCTRRAQARLARWTRNNCG
jgi:hypothetical protein